MKNKSTRHFLQTVGVPFAVLASVAIIIWAILQGYSAARTAWTGFGDFTTPAGEFVRGKTLWDWLELLIIPLVLAVGAILFNWSERANERRSNEARSKLEHELASESQREAALQSYLDRMADLMLNQRLLEIDNPQVRNIATVRTFTVLRALDPDRKGIALVFLYHAGLIRRKPIVDLTRADLMRARLIEEKLSEANLSGAWLYGAQLWMADLTHADLSNAYLQDADFHKANLSWADLSGANLLAADLSEAELHGANLNSAGLWGAKLHAANLTGANLQKADFRNAAYDSRTQWPEGFDPQAAGAILKDK